MQSPSLSKEVFKFPSRPVLRKHLKQYIDQCELHSAGVTGLKSEGSREDTLFLLRVVWGVAQGLVDEEGRRPKGLEEGLSVKPDTGKF